MDIKIFGVLPARYGSTRFPGKPLAMIAGVPMVVRAYRCALDAGVFDTLIVATDDERILRLCDEYGVPALMTRVCHVSGSDRVYEAFTRAASRDTDIIVNVQGDHPLLPRETFARLVRPLCTLAAREPGSAAVSSLYAPLHDAADFMNPNVVKVALGAGASDGFVRALSFSRAPSGFAEGSACAQSALCAAARSAQSEESNPLCMQSGCAAGGQVYRHIGLYAYTPPALERFVRLPVSPLEKLESLEQLRLLENGIPIYMEQAEGVCPAVDTPADIQWVASLINIKS